MNIYYRLCIFLFCVGLKEKGLGCGHRGWGPQAGPPLQDPRKGSWRLQAAPPPVLPSLPEGLGAERSHLLAQSGARVSAELELPAQGLFPPPSRNCPGARGEGDLTEAAGCGGAPVDEAATVLGTAGRVSGRRPSSWSCARASAQDELLRGRGSLPPVAAVQKERPSASGPGELRSLLSLLPLAWLAGPGGRGEWVGLSVLRGNGEREAQGLVGASAPLPLTAGKKAENANPGSQAPCSAESLCAPSSLR